MKIIVTVLIMLHIGFWQAQAQLKCNVCYVSNEGFILECNNTKILVDALFDTIDGNWCHSPSKTLVDSMVNELPPFNDVDIVAISHMHRDHFNRDIVAAFLKNNTKCKVICPVQVHNELKICSEYNQFKDRLIAVSPDNLSDTLISVVGIQVQILRLEHSHYMIEHAETHEMVNKHDDIENLGYVFTIDEKKIFHSGDTNPLNKEEYEKFRLDEENLSLAFVDRMFIGKGKVAMDVLNNYIAPPKLVLMHLNPANVVSFKNHLKEYSHIKIFSTPMETHTFLME